MYSFNTNPGRACYFKIYRYFEYSWRYPVLQ